MEPGGQQKERRHTPGQVIRKLAEGDKLLTPLTQVATTTPTLETVDLIAGATTTGCTPTENVAPFTSTNPAGSFTMPNCSIVGGVGDSVTFIFESETGLAVNSNAFTIPNVPPTSTAGYTCPNGGQLDASGVTCFTGSGYSATYSTVSDITRWRFGVGPNFHPGG